MKPIIGINLDIEKGPPARAQVNLDYFESVQRAGGIPLLIPPLPDEDLLVLLEKIDGLVLIGGDDYSPSIYGEEPSDKVDLLHPKREEFDLRLVKHVLNRPEMPVLGICGGLQLLNIGLGGSLIQDIPSALPQSPVMHSKPNAWLTGFQRHHVSIERASMLGRLYRVDSIEVNSFHHQAIKQLGSGLVASAHAEDGIIEAVELPSRTFTVAVQWHPERDFEGNKSLFEQLVKESAKVSRQSGATK